MEPEHFEHPTEGPDEHAAVDSTERTTGDSTDHTTGDRAEHAADPPAAPPVDLEAVATDLADVEVALARLEAGTYWTDEVTGEPLPDDLLAASPTARRLSDS